MKSILIVAEDEISAKSMLEKSLRFAPQDVRVVVFEYSNSNAEDIQSVIDEVGSNNCRTEMVLSPSTTLKDKTETLTQMVSQIDPDMVVVHRPQLGKEVPDFSFIKAILKSTTQSIVLLCGNKPWKPKINILATIDTTDESPSQVSLNTKVLNLAVEVSGCVNAEVELLTVLPISKVSEELDLVNPAEILLKKGATAKDKLDSFSHSKEESSNFSTHVVAGAPYEEIPSSTKKLKSNLVILGNVGRTGIKGLIIGNTAEKILTKLAVDALIVKQ